MKNTKQLATGEYLVDWTELGEEIIEGGWQSYIEGDDLTRAEAIKKHIEKIDPDEIAMFIVCAMSKRLMAMEKTLKKMEKALNKKQEATAE